VEPGRGAVRLDRDLEAWVNDTAVIHRQKDRGNKRGKDGQWQTTWKMSEIAELRRLAPLGAQVVADQLGRSVWSVRKQAYRLRISLRPSGERRGVVLGQPRGTRAYPPQRLRFLRQLREDILAGRIDVVRMERRIRAITHGADLCPECAKRPIENERTGLCEDCHLDRLTWAHALEADRAEKDRQLLRERQRKSRARRQVS
jgi:hypothetical protein